MGLDDTPEMLAPRSLRLVTPELSISARLPHPQEEEAGGAL